MGEGVYLICYMCFVHIQQLESWRLVYRGLSAAGERAQAGAVLGFYAVGGIQ